jgi:hypothetical protein
MRTKYLALIAWASVSFFIPNILGIQSTNAEDYPFGVYGFFEHLDDWGISKDFCYNQVAECGFNYVFAATDSTTEDLTSIKNAGLKTYFVEQYLNRWYRGVAHLYSMGHYTKWEAEGTEIAGYSLQHYGGFDSNGVMIWRASPVDSARTILEGPVRIRDSDLGYYQCYNYQWIWSPWVPWTASFRLRTNNNSGSDTVAIITVSILDSIGTWHDSSYTLFSNSFPTGADSSFTINYSFDGLVNWVLGKVKFKIYWFNTRDLYIDRIEVYDSLLGADIFSKPDSVANSIYRYAATFTRDTQIAGFLLDDEPPTIDRLHTYRYVDSILAIVSDDSGITQRGITAYADNRGGISPPLAEYFIEISKPYIYMGDIYPLNIWDSSFSFQGKINKTCGLLDTLRKITNSKQKEFYYISQAFGYRDSTWINPAPNEMECFINLGLAYKVDGIVLFNYNDSYDTVIIGLVNSDSNFTPRENWYRVQSIAPKVKKIGLILRNLSWQGTFIDDSTNDLSGHGGGYIDSIRSNDEPHWMQVGFFKSAYGDTNYFMLVNRECGVNEGANYDVFVNKSGVPHKMRDMYTDSIVGNVCGNGDYFTVYLEPGEGKLFRLEPRERIIYVLEDDTIQVAINASCDGDTVLVAPGTYYENINFSGKAITLASHLIINEHDSTLIDSTIIDGSYLMRHPDSGSVVTFISGEDSNSILIGFTLTGGIGTKTDTLGSKTFYDGGGVYCYNSSPHIVSNRIIDNNIYRYGPTEYGQGGGICGKHYSNPIIINNLIYNNTGDIGGGVYFSGNPLIVNNTLVNNTGGGIVINGGTPLISNNIIANNINGGGIYFISSPPCTVSYNDVWGHGDYNFVSCLPGTGQNTRINFNRDSCDNYFNIVKNPRFIDSTANYHLLASSPCINAGDDNAPALPAFDFDFSNRIIGCNVDMGVYEFWYKCGDANGDDSVTVSDVVYLINYLFKGGLPPIPKQSGDANCDGTVSVSDIVYLNNYLFKGGPPPCG